MSGIPFCAQIRIPLISVLFLLPFVPGCGGGRPPVEPAQGKVVCGDRPVTGGSVTFMPVAENDRTNPGKPATGIVGSDGTFVLTTYEPSDGATVGKHRVQYIATEDGAEEEEAAPSSERWQDEPTTKAKSAGAKDEPQYVQKGELIVEVKADGENDFTIELSPAEK